MRRARQRITTLIAFSSVLEILQMLRFRLDGKFILLLASRNEYLLVYTNDELFLSCFSFAMQAGKQ